MACVFDAYGTLFDYASAAARFGETLGPRWELLSSLWREKQLQYTWLRTIQDKHVDFWRVTGDALDFALEALGIEAAGLRGKLMDAYWTLDAFPEVPDVLERLRTKGIKTAILSNGSPEMLRGAVSHAGLTGLLDEVLSVEEVGVYKPHPKVYQLAVERLRMPRKSVSFLSSNAWDAWAASAFGMRVIWCNRYAQPRERLPGNPGHQVTSLRDLPFLDRDS
ncbi:MAG TPA: haloacid dehalogenase type II [Bryobacteraceae bacterium]|nr:haloacid dehalogenase type II [Bryobacteraceae bacterium]